MAELTITRLAGSAQREDLLVVGPALGTSVSALWTRCAALLDAFEVVGWDLPGHGLSKPALQAFSIQQLAATVRDIALETAGGREISYAGVSLGGAVGLELAVEPGPFGAVAVLASAPKIGDSDAWRQRADIVRRAGIDAMVAGSAQRWFAPGFTDRHPHVADALLASLSDTDPASYAFACEALAEFDLRDRVADTKVPFFVAAGQRDVVVSPEQVRATVLGATFAVVQDCGHLPPAEDPTEVAELLTEFFATQRGGR